MASLREMNLMLAKIIAIIGITLSLSAYANENTEPVTTSEIVPYVVGGVDSKRLELPWQVYITIEKDSGTFACGGTLITDTWVVTAAHCVNEKDDKSGFVPVNSDQVTVYSGDIDLNGNMSTNTVTNIIASEDYDLTNNTGDIALLKLSLPVALPAQPIKLMDNALQTDADLEFEAAVWDNLIVSGWGRTSTDGIQSTNILQKTAVSGVGDYSCALTWGWPRRDESFICANAHDRGSCNGDSGGPLIWQDKSAQSDNDRGYRLAGVVSFGHIEQCAYNLYPDIYTEVSTHTDWIIAKIAEIDMPGIYQEPNSTFTQDIFFIEEGPQPSGTGESPQPAKKSGGGIGYSMLLLLSGLLLYRHRN